MAVENICCKISGMFFVSMQINERPAGSCFDNLERIKRINFGAIIHYFFKIFPKHSIFFTPFQNKSIDKHEVSPIMCMIMW